jgi:hypothetical protein
LRQEDEASWAQKTGLAPAAIHRMWLSSSHFADEKDDDSRIELLDTKSLAGLKQILMVTSAGEPRCLTLTVFSNGAEVLKLWSTDSTPEGRGLCDKLGLSARFTMNQHGIEIIVPLDRHSVRSSYADVEHCHYRWAGKTYLASDKSLELESIPQ